MKTNDESQSLSIYHILKDDESIESNACLIIDESYERLLYDVGIQYHETTPEIKHVQVNRPKCLDNLLVKPYSEDIQLKESFKTIIPKDNQENLKYGSKKEGEPRMDWNEYHRLNVIHDFLEELDSDYPSICTVGVIGTSLEDRELKILKVSNSNASNPAVWMDAGIHAREWIAPAVATYVANHIVRNFTNLPSSITNKDWYFHPVVNPDGYEHSHTGDRMWRKNRARHKGVCVGVDLNRNFSYCWGGKESSGNPSNTFYRGPEPFSEPESRAIRDFILNSEIPFKVYITLHSYGQVILFPYASKDEPCPDYVRLLEGATVMSKAIHDTNGNTYKVGVSRDVMYGAAGTSNDWSYGVAGIPYCYLIELRSKKHKFMLPKDEIEETGNEILNCVKALMEFIDGKERVSIADNCKDDSTN
ncbi:carboxypeptidase B-like [Bicyclus anynana]|uniref:Carboxypeptidase B-like n=1 Tax=Bicyclus anynana TaxID=110368 RepID=A0A6J1MNM4_BICAN|nr:carboxypeptidase B-like [Bicyclus anynana]